MREAIRAATSWIPAVDTDGDLREHAQVCEITGLVDATGWPEDTRFLVRRERPAPGRQLSLFDTIEGWRHQVVATDAPPRVSTAGANWRRYDIDASSMPSCPWSRGSRSRRSAHAAILQRRSQ